MNFQDIPLIFQVLRDEDLKPISQSIEGDKIVCEDSNGNKFLMKDIRGIEGIIFEKVFPQIKSLNLTFSTLILPEHRCIVSKQVQIDGKNKQRDFIFIKLYEGKSFNSIWNEGSAEGYGGRAIPIDIADKAVTILEDFKKIDVSTLSTFSLPTFNFDHWKTLNFPTESEELIKNGILTQAHIDKGIAILQNPTLFQNSEMILSNGDFYPRNFIEMTNGKIVIIDWEGRTDYHKTGILNGVTTKFTGQRNSLINYVENHAAFFFIHMWGNNSVQREFVKKIVTKFNLTAENLQAALLIKSFEQSRFFGNNYLGIRQAEIFYNSLDINYIKDLIK